jgi:diguanylate cyclase (GGDEF)-like protein
MTNRVDAMATQPDEDGSCMQTSTRTPLEQIREHSFLLIDVMPVAVFVIDRTGNILYVNQRLVDMVGISREALLGRSAFEFTDPRDTEFALDLLNASSEYHGTILGPCRIRYVEPTGECHHSQFWAYECPPEIGVQGYVIALTAESVRDVLATAVAAVAADEPLERNLAAIATSGRAAPLDGIGTILVVEPASSTEAEHFRAVGRWPLDTELINATGTPWHQSFVTGQMQDITDCELPGVDGRSRDGMASAGMRAAWVRPVLHPSGEVAAVFIVWRRTPSRVSPNHETHLSEATRLIHLVLEQARHRSELEVAAHRDALTGLGNRASLNDRIEHDTGHPSALFIDLDQFKAVNDTFGHSVGDEVIAKVGRRISAAVRRGDDVYRSGGDEFVVVCASGPEGPNAAEDLFVLANRIADCIAAPFDCHEHRIRIGATIGIAAGRLPTGSSRPLEKTIRVADRAMYVAKERGRGSVHHADAPN